MDEITLRRRGRIRFVTVTIGLLVVGVFGYLGFVGFVESDKAGTSSVLILGALTGFAAFFSPCSFPLLLTFLTGRGEESKGSALMSALRVGAGATFLLGILGLTLAVGASALASIVQFDSPSGRVFRLAVGVILIVFGLRQSRLIVFRMGWMDSVARTAGGRFAPSRTATRAGGDFAYGFGYLLAGFG